MVLWISPQTQALHRLYLHFPGFNLQFDFVPMIDKGLFDLATCWFETKMGSGRALSGFMFLIGTETGS